MLIWSLWGKHRGVAWLRGTVGLVFWIWSGSAAAQLSTSHSRRFTLTDDIELTRFASDAVGSVLFSPDERYFVVVTKRGRLDINRPESSLRIYLSDDIHKFLASPEATDQGPAPLWTISESGYKNGPTVSNLRWLPDSQALAFLAKAASGNDRLWLAEITEKTVRPLTPENLHVTGFAVRSASRYVYSVLSPSIHDHLLQEKQQAAFMATGRSLESLIFPEGSSSPSIWIHDLSELWAVIEGRHFRVMDPASGEPLPIHLEGERALSLSPDGRYAVTALTVSDVPAEWETLYPPPASSVPYGIRPGYHNPYSWAGQRDLSEYVLLELSTGKTKSLTHAPLGDPVGWWGLSQSDWSSDGQSVLLSDTFIAHAQEYSKVDAKHPCTAVADLAIDKLTCVEHVKSPDEDGPFIIENAQFVRGNKDSVALEYFRAKGNQSACYLRSSRAIWAKQAACPNANSRSRELEISIRQGLNSPPVLVAADRDNDKSRVIWNPNPQLGNVAFGKVSVFHWKDGMGRSWAGGLFLPPDYVPGMRYPLVIQNHGFNEEEFSPSGASTTAFAAQELASAGIVVLQVRDCAVRSSPEEGPCQVRGYDAAVKQLDANGLIDPKRVGIVGFSRTCYYVLEALTAGQVQFQAASITDGVDEGYLQYILNVDADSNNTVERDANGVIGAQPFAGGLQQWLTKSPEFNLDRVHTPLHVVATAKQVLQMWEPYAALRYLNKPVDLEILNSDEHVLTNPAERLASQGGTVDWFRFWLQGYEDRDPAKAARNARWREMRTLYERSKQSRARENRGARHVPRPGQAYSSASYAVTDGS